MCVCVCVCGKGKTEETCLMVCVFANAFRRQSFFECESVLLKLF